MVDIVRNFRYGPFFVLSSFVYCGYPNFVIISVSTDWFPLTSLHNLSNRNSQGQYLKPSKKLNRHLKVGKPRVTRISSRSFKQSFHWKNLKKASTTLRIQPSGIKVTLDLTIKHTRTQHFTCTDCGTFVTFKQNFFQVLSQHFLFICIFSVSLCFAISNILFSAKATAVSAIVAICLAAFALWRCDSLALWLWSV